MILRINILDNGSSAFLNRTCNSIKDQITGQVSWEILDCTAFWKPNRNILCADADYVLFLYSGSILEENAVKQICETLEKNKPSWLYFDEQTFDAQINGKPFCYLEKPDFDPLAFAQNVYTGEGVVFSRECLERMELRYEGSNFSVALTEMSIAAAMQAEPVHIGKILLTRSNKMPFSQKETDQLAERLQKYLQLRVENMQGFCKMDEIGLYIRTSLLPASEISVIAITNSEDCTSMPEISSLRTEFEMIPVMGNLPYWEKCCWGAQKATHDILCFITPEYVECSGETLELLSCYTRMPEAGMVSPRIMGKNEQRVGCYSVATKQFFVSGNLQNSRNVLEDFMTVRETSLPAWQCWMIPRNLFLEMMEPGINILEENDYSKEHFMLECVKRAQKAGKKNLYIGSVSVKERMTDTNNFDTGFYRILSQYRERFVKDPFFPVKFNSYKRQHSLNFLTYFPEQMQNYDPKKRKLLVLTHELSLSGAPIVLSHAVHILQEENCHVVVVSPKDGSLRNAFLQENVPVIIWNDLNQREEWLDWVREFDLVLVNTVVMFKQIQQLGNLPVPVMWWLHDAKSGYEDELQYILPETVPENVSIFSVSQYADNAMKKYRPKYKSSLLHYGLADKGTGQQKIVNLISEVKNKQIFIAVGTVVRRKGQDILTMAIRMLPESVRKQCLFLFIGKTIDNGILEYIKKLEQDFPEEVHQIEAVPHEEILNLYHHAAAVICSSRDDPLPTFMAETMMVSGVCICSENTGTASVIRHGENGFLYGNDDPEKLAKCIQRIVETDDLGMIRKEARKTYETYFTMDIFKKNLMKCVEQSICYASEGECK